MKAIADMTDTELLNLVFERVGLYVGPDGTGLAVVAVYNGRLVAGPNGSGQLTRYYALCYLAAHALAAKDGEK